MPDAIFDSFGYLTIIAMVVLGVANIGVGVLAVTHHERLVRAVLKRTSFYASFLRFGGDAHGRSGHR